MPKRTSDTGKGPFVRRSETRPQPSVVANKAAPAHDDFAKVWVRNQTGANRHVFDVVKLGESVVDPTTSDDHERAFWSRMAFDAEEVDEDGISNVAILTAPVQSGNSQKALATGVSVVKLTGVTGKTRATTKSGAYTLEAADSGPFEILHDPGPTGEERYAYVRFDGSSETGDTTLTDGCECEPGNTREGDPLAGSPTICCSGHERLQCNFGEVLGIKTLFHAGGDIWSTFNEDEELDNPWTISCGSGMEDIYDIVLTLTSTGSKITLEARDDPICDPVCVEFEKTDTFACKGANRFRKVRFTNASDLRLPECVCLRPPVQPSSAGCLDLCGGMGGEDQLFIELPDGDCSKVPPGGFYRLVPHQTLDTGSCRPRSPGCVWAWEHNPVGNSGNYTIELKYCAESPCVNGCLHGNPPTQVSGKQFYAHISRPGEGPTFIDGCFDWTCVTRNGVDAIRLDGVPPTEDCPGGGLFCDMGGPMYLYRDLNFHPADSGHCTPCGEEPE